MRRRRCSMLRRLTSGAAAPTLVHVVERYVKAGIEHIFLGYDHVAFLIAIVLWARRLWPVIKIVTAYGCAFHHAFAGRPTDRGHP
jgi:hydrogenase/urease accessory protein HupE